MLTKVQRSKEAAQRRTPVVKSAAEKLAELRAFKARSTKMAIAEARRLELGKLAYSKPSDHETGMNYGLDARKARKQMLSPANKVRKESDFGTRTATFGTKTDAGINAYYRNKRSDNMPK